MSALDTWESKLKDRVCSEQILLGELGFRRRDLDEIGDLFKYRRIIGSHGKELSEREKIEHVSRRWPLTYALFLVLGGIYDYESGEYWDGPCKRLGLPSDQTDHWGQRFLDILAEYSLPTFEHSGGLTYVTPILLHGGIPNDFLDAFFDFLWRQEKKQHQIGLDSISLLQMWRQQPEEYFRYLPASVRRFLEYGGRVASDFVERCLELFDTDSLEEAEALVDLPPRVVRAFERWRNGKNIPTRIATPRVRLQRPILSITPYTEGVTLYLPAQQFPHRIAPRELVWRLADSTQSICCNMRRIEGGTQFEVQERIYVSPALQYVLHLEADGERLQTWTLPGLAEPPVLFFDPYDDYEGEVLLEQRRFHSGERWLLYPQSCQWQETGSSRKLRVLPELSGVWQGYRVEAWQLAPGAMTLQDEHGRSYSFNVIHEKAQQRPRLIDGNRPPLPITAADFPLYIGRPPTLILYTDQPHLWQVAIRAAGRAQPDDHRPRRLSQLPFISAEDGLYLDLAIPELLGEIPIGKFEIVLRGPLGQSYRFGIRCIPALAVDGLTQLYLLDANQAAQFRLRCDLSTQIRQNPPQEGVNIHLVTEEQEQREYNITAVPEIKQINLQLRHDCGVVMPWTIPIHRLRWGLWSGEDDHYFQWQTQPSTVYPGALPYGTLWVDVPVVREKPLRVGWQLINASGEICRELPPNEQPVQRRLEWSVAEVMAVWRERQETLCWQLVVQVAELDEPYIIPAFYLLPTLEFGDVTYEWQMEDDQIHLTLLWEKSQQGSYQLNLWPLDRPWIARPISLQLSKLKGAFAEWRLTTKELPSEAYLAEVVIYNPWRSTEPQRPKPGAPNTFLVKPSSLSQYYDEIIRLREQREASIEQLLALLAHQYYNHRLNDLHRTNKAIYDMAESLDPVWLLYWADSIQQFDKTAYTTTQMKLFLLSSLAKLAQNYRDSTIRKYFSHLPDQLQPQLLSKIAIAVLRTGLRMYYPSCLEVIFQQSFQGGVNQDAFDEVMSALLHDVGDGMLTVNDAVELLRINQELATVWLVHNGGLEASELLQEFAVHAQIQPDWVAPGMVLDCNYGSLEIEGLRHRSTNEISFCAPLDGKQYADGRLKATPTPVSVRLDLSNRLLHFSKSEPYLCQHCDELFTSLADCSWHHQSTHPQLAPARKRIRQNSALSWLRPRPLAVDGQEEVQG